MENKNVIIPTHHTYINKKYIVGTYTYLSGICGLCHKIGHPIVPIGISIESAMKVG